VWLGFDEKFGRTVALKQVGPPGFVSLYRDQAEREARAAANLKHPHAAMVLDLAMDDETGRLWLVTEPVDGTTLTDLVRHKGALPVADAASLSRQVAEALAAAHAAGVVHRDVKPANLVVDPFGRVKVTDFGVTRVPTDATRTHAELVTGSRAYLAPEVAAGRTGDEASDVWSLGATAVFALTGRPPYDMGDHVLGGLDRIVREDPPRVPDAGGLTPLLEATMDKDPARRWPMARVQDFLAGAPAAVAAAGLAAVASAPAATSRRAPAVVDSEIAATLEAPTPRTPGTGVKVALVAALLSTIGLGTAYFLGESSGSNTSAGPDRTTVSPIGPGVATPLNAPASSPVISASGTLLGSPSALSSGSRTGQAAGSRSSSPLRSSVHGVHNTKRADHPATSRSGSRSGSRSSHGSAPRSHVAAPHSASHSPTHASASASGSPSDPSSGSPSHSPSGSPSGSPSESDSPSPSDSPSQSPSQSPSESDSPSPSGSPSGSPTD
jgi:serine/threonine protein kinase